MRDALPYIDSILRWLHVVAGILWIGHLWFFNFVNANFAPTMDGDTKRKVVPELMPRALFWFRHGAAFTWATGFLLVGVLYYMNTTNLFVRHAELADPPWDGLRLAMLAVTFLAPFLYEVLAGNLLKTGPGAFFGGFALVCAALYGYETAGYAMRGYQIHLGILFGTIMAYNVWFRIWPAQKRIIKAIKSGAAPDAGDVALAGTRSKHNTYMSGSVLFLMLTSHNAWCATDAVFPWPTALMVFVAWGLVAHIYMISRRVKGF